MAKNYLVIKIFKKIEDPLPGFMIKITIKRSLVEFFCKKKSISFRQLPCCLQRIEKSTLGTRGL